MRIFIALSKLKTLCSGMALLVYGARDAATQNVALVTLSEIAVCAGSTMFFRCLVYQFTHILSSHFP